MDAANPASQLPRLVAAIELLTEEELSELNRIVVARLRLIHQIRAHQHMVHLRVGQRVRFADEAGGTIKGVLLKHNRKSVTIIADNGMQWRVSPTLVIADE